MNDKIVLRKIQNCYAKNTEEEKQSQIPHSAPIKFILLYLFLSGISVSCKTVFSVTISISNEFALSLLGHLILVLRYIQATIIITLSIVVIG